MRKLTGLLIIALAAAAFAAPSSAQTPIAPEATAEPLPPLEMVFRNAQNCFFSGDGAIVVPAEGVFNLPDGTLRFAFPALEGDLPRSGHRVPESNLISMQGLGVYDATSGRLIIRTQTEDELARSGFASFVSNERWGGSARGIYDLQTLELVYTPPERDGESAAWLMLSLDSDIATIGYGDEFGHKLIVRLPEGEILAEIESGWAQVSPDETYIFILGDGLYRLGESTRILPLVSENPISFSPDSQHIAVTARDGATIYRTSDGEMVLQLAYPNPDIERWGLGWTTEKLLFLNGSTVPFVSEANQISVYSFPEGRMLFQREGIVIYLGGVRDAWMHDDQVFDPYTGEILLDGVHFYNSYVSEEGLFITPLGEYDLDTWTLTRAYPQNTSQGYSIPVYNDRYRLFPSVGLYEMQTGAEVLSLLNTNLDLSPDERFLATTRSGSECRVYDLSTTP